MFVSTTAFNAQISDPLIGGFPRHFARYSNSIQFSSAIFLNYFFPEVELISPKYHSFIELLQERT